MSIRMRGSRSYQVRVAPFAAQTVPTREAALRLELDLKLRRVGGAASPERPTKLGEEIDGFLTRLRAAGGLRPRSMEFYEQKSKVWKPLRGVRVSALRRAEVEAGPVACRWWSTSVRRDPRPNGVQCAARDRQYLA